MKHICTLLFALVLTCSSLAQNALSLRLDTTALNGLATYEGVAMADGGNALLVVGLGEASLWKCDAAGVALWRNVYPSPAQGARFDLAACSNGDLLLSYTASTGGADTLFAAFEVWRIGSDGSVLWHNRYEQEVQVFFQPLYMDQVTIMENDLAEVFILHVAEVGGQYLVTVTKLGSTGALSWTSRVGAPSNAMLFPCNMNECLPEIKFYPDTQGGCRLTVPTAENSDESALFLSLAPDGSFEWASNFDYLGTVNTIETFAPVVMNDGTTVLMTLSTSLNGGMHLIHISDSGTLLKVDRYELSSNCCAGLAYDQGTLTIRFYESVFTVDASGGIVTASTAMDLTPDTDYQYYLNSSFFDVQNGRALLSGGFMAYPTGAGLPLASPALVSFTLAETPACGRMPFSVAHDVLPLSLFTATPEVDMAAEPLGLSTVAMSDTPEPRPLLASVDLCVLTGMAPLAEAPAAFSVTSTLLHSGEMITATSDRPLRYSLVDGKGAVVRNDARASQRLEMPTAELTGGLYMLIGRDVTGQVAGVAKVVVER